MRMIWKRTHLISHKSMATEWRKNNNSWLKDMIGRRRHNILPMKCLLTVTVTVTVTVKVNHRTSEGKSRKLFTLQIVRWRAEWFDLACLCRFFESEPYLINPNVIFQSFNLGFWLKKTTTFFFKTCCRFLESNPNVILQSFNLGFWLKKTTTFFL